MQISTENTLRSLSRRQVLGNGAACATLALGTGLAGARKALAATQELRMIGWGDYINPANIAAWENANDMSLLFDGYDDNQQIYDRLKLTSGDDYFDIGMNTDYFFDQLIREGVIQKLDKSLLPNTVNIPEEFLAPHYDPDNAYTIPKSLGYVGFLYDTAAISRPMKTWGDFLEAMQNEASGRTTLLDSDEMGLAPLFWAKDVSWNTLDELELQDADDRVIGLAKHVKAFKDYAEHDIRNGSVVLAQVWSGYGGRVLRNAGKPNLAYVNPSPRTCKLIDCYHIPTGARNIAGAHSWLNFVLEPATAAKEIEYVNFYAPVKGLEAYIAPAYVGDPVIFPPDDVVKRAEWTMRNASFARRAKIFEKFKNAAEM